MGLPLLVCTGSPIGHHCFFPSRILTVVEHRTGVVHLCCLMDCSSSLTQMSLSSLEDSEAELLPSPCLV